jgi:hypothetical protein
MSGRTVVILTVLVVVLAGWVWWGSGSGEDDRADRLLGDLAPGQVAGLDLIWEGEVIVLDRRGEAEWVVSADGGAPRPADRLVVERFLGALAALGPGRLLDDADPAETGLDRPRGRIALRGDGSAEDEVLAILDVGAPVPGSDRVVVRLEFSGDIRAVADGVVRELARRTADGGESWRDVPPAEESGVEESPEGKPSGEAEEPSLRWTERVPAEIDRIVLDSTLLVGDEPLDLIRGPRDWVVVDDPGTTVPFPDVSDLLRAVTTARAEVVEAAGEAGGTPVLYLTLADAPGARRETLTLFAPESAESAESADVRWVSAASTARPGVLLRLPVDTARQLERTVREVAAAVSGPGTPRPANGRPEP